MAYTFGDQLNFASTLLADSSTDSTSMWPLAQRKTEINHAEKQFARDTKAILEKTTGTMTSATLTMPSGWIETYALYVTIGGSERLITNDREISPKDLERYSDYAGDIPYYYFWKISGTDTITFVGSSAVQTAAYTLFYFEEPTTALDDTTDVSLLPEVYRQAPVYKACSNLLLQIGQYTRSQALLAHYERLALQAREETRQRYRDYENPRPDLNMMGTDPVDIQGQGDFY